MVHLNVDKCASLETIFYGKRAGMVLTSSLWSFCPTPNCASELKSSGVHLHVCVYISVASNTFSCLSYFMTTIMVGLI